MTSSTPWIKAQASGTGGQCVEMRRSGNSIEVRDSKDPEGPTLCFTSRELGAWIDGAKNGEFDQFAVLSRNS